MHTLHYTVRYLQCNYRRHGRWLKVVKDRAHCLCSTHELKTEKEVETGVENNFEGSILQHEKMERTKLTMLMNCKEYWFMSSDYLLLYVHGVCSLCQYFLMDAQQLWNINFLFNLSISLIAHIVVLLQRADHCTYSGWVPWMLKGSWRLWVKMAFWSM